MRFVACGLLAAAAVAQPARTTVVQGVSRTLQGMLIDAGCQDRSLWNLRRPPESQSAALAAAQNQAASGGAAADGISVDAQTLAAERQDIAMVMNSDPVARQSDPTCAVKANTKAFALLMPNGRLIDLDDGGNTYATVAVQESSAGQAMINGTGPGFKPRATVKGIVEGDRVFTDEVKLRH